MDRLSGRTGADVSVGERDIADLRQGLQGGLLAPADPDYDRVRKVWNGSIDRHPGLVVRCAGVEDVRRAVAFARTFDLLVSVRCGGHNVAGKAVCERGLMIDLSPMQGVRVDPERRIAQIEGGATLARLDHATQPFGLATTAGVVTHTGVAGLTLGGGVGRLARKYGLACDNLLAVEVVTADGRLLRASDTENQDLFWGLRGGGGNFGIATSFTFRLHPIGTEVLRCSAAYPMEKAKQTLRFFWRYACDAPDEVTASAAFVTAGDGTPLLSLGACHIAPLAEAERVLQPLATFGRPLSSTIETIPYLQIQAEADSVFPHGQHYYWKTHFLEDLPDDAIDLLIERFAAVPGPLSLIGFQQYGGAISRIGPGETAFHCRSAQFDFLPMAIWREPEAAEAHRAWARDTWQAMAPFSSGGEYINNLGDVGEERIRAAVGANYDWLVALKDRYDPTNFFRLNANIRPSRPA